jgi:hypothetical protein
LSGAIEHYCLKGVFPPPDSALLCALDGIGGRPCQAANPIGQSCDPATETYLYEYNRTTFGAYGLDTQRYYVCDGGTWQLGS